MTQYLSQKALAGVVLSSLLLGFLLGAVYDVLRIRRRILPIKSRLASTIAVAFEDVLFFAIGGCLTSLMFYLVNNGEVRIMGVLGLVPGFVVWRLTLSRLLMCVVDLLLGLIRRLYIAIMRRILAPIGRRFANIFGLVGRKVDNIKRKHRTKRVICRAIRDASRGFDVKSENIKVRRKARS